MNLDARAVDEQPVGNPVFFGKRTKDAFQYSAFCPTHEPIIERLLRALRHDDGRVSARVIITAVDAFFSGLRVEPDMPGSLDRVAVAGPVTSRFSDV